MDSEMFRIISMLAIPKAILIVIIFGAFLLLVYCDNKGEGVMMDENNKKSLSLGKDLIITVVYDNNPYNEILETAWGFSCVIKGLDKTILFDTGGDGEILLDNMEKLGVNPGEIELVVLSHIHGDHVGGLESLLEENPEVVVYLLRSFPGSFKDDIKNYGTKIVEVENPLEITKNAYSTGVLGVLIKEQSLILRTEKGLIVITGCAHPGIVKIVSKAKDLLDEDVLFVMGGFHLGGESKREIEKILSDFKELGVRYAGPCHCSGSTARGLFEKEYKKNFIKVGVGRVITIANLKDFKD